MIEKTTQRIINEIRTGELDCNNQELFFSILIKGLLLQLNEDISIRGTKVPHMIIHTGSDIMYLEHKGQNNSVEPFNVSNEDYIYQIVPRGMVTPGSVDLLPDQLTNPYTYGQFEIDAYDTIQCIKCEFRRMPLKLGVEIKYFVSSYIDLLELIQQIITKLSFLKTFNISYMGQVIQCSYKIPETFSDEHLTELDGKTQDDKYHVMNIGIEVETNIPVFFERTAISSDQYIRQFNSDLDTEYSIAIDIRNDKLDKLDKLDKIPSYIDMDKATELANGKLTNEELLFNHDKLNRKSRIIIKNLTGDEIIERNSETRNDS